MILSLFRVSQANPAAALYAEIVGAARQPGWYREAGVPDTIDARYCVLATLLALADLRLANGGEVARGLAPRLTELFIADMDAQLCQNGMGDPTLGKTVRAMVAGVSARIERWRRLFEADSGEWQPVLGFSLYRGREPDPGQAGAARDLVEQWRARLDRASDGELGAGLPA